MDGVVSEIYGNESYCLGKKTYIEILESTNKDNNIGPFLGAPVNLCLSPPKCQGVRSVFRISCSFLRPTPWQFEI